MKPTIPTSVIPFLAAIAIASCCFSALLLGQETASRHSQMPAKTRRFQFRYGATLRQVPPGSKVRVWIPVPPSNEHQRVRLLRSQLPTNVMRQARDATYGNKIRYFQTTVPESGSVGLEMLYLVERHEVRGLSVDDGVSSKAGLSATQRQIFLAPNSLVPTQGKPLELLDGLKTSEDPLCAARQIYDLVDAHMRYDKSRPGYGNGDVLWACDSRFGNCTDFHSLFISLTRATGVPARFEIGFPLPAQRGQGPIAGYHCWAFFHVDKHGWVPVDISEADKQPAMKDYYFGNLTENRVTFSLGRDLILVPRQAGPALNFLIYPYAEVDGTPWPRDRMSLEFSFQDL